jgi:photosystem II stability/assembly factor-like uncharacterized protein
MVIRRRTYEPLGIILAHDDGLVTAIPGGDIDTAVSGHRFTSVDYHDGLAIAGSPEGGAWVHDGKRWEHQWAGNARSVSVTPDGDLFIGADGGSLYRSRDRGETWEEIEGALNVIKHGTRFVPNAGENHVFVKAVVRSEEGVLLGFAGGSAWHTRDDGKSWTRRGEGLDPKIHGLWVHPEHRDRIYATTDSGIYRSEDEGFSWLHSKGGLDRSWGGSLAVLPGAPDALVATLARTPDGERGAVFRSPNGGVSWSRVELEGDDEWERIPCVARPWDWEDVVFVVTGTKLWASHDRGRNFIELQDDLPVANAIAASL